MGMCMLMCVYIHMFICILISSCITLFKFSHPKVTLVNVKIATSTNIGTYERPILHLHLLLFFINIMFVMKNKFC